MATICLFSEVNNAAPLLSSFADHHAIVLVDPDGESGEQGRVRVVGSVDDVETTFDVIVDAGLDADYMFVDAERLCPGGIILVNGVDETATQGAASLGEEMASRARVLAFSFLPGLFPSSSVIEVSIATQIPPVDHASLLERVGSLFRDRKVEHVEDRLGLVSARVLAMILNEAAFAVMEGVATSDDIDTAMRLGTSYPAGPLAWCDAIGAGWVVHLLDGLYEEYRDERYRACVLLRQMARAGGQFHTTT